jgi:hypothetical protein
VRSRQRKKSYQETLEQALQEHNKIIKKLTEERSTLKNANIQLLNENT